MSLTFCFAFVVGFFEVHLRISVSSRGQIFWTALHKNGEDEACTDKSFIGKIQVIKVWAVFFLSYFGIFITVER